MPKIATILSDDGQGQKSISLMLTRDALFLDADGLPSPGIGLSATQAPALAERLLMLASQAEGMPKTAADSSAILVVHDGTTRGASAFELALTMARDSDALLYLHVRDQFAWHRPGDVVAQCASQLSLLQEVAARCATKAARQGVRMKPCVMTIDEEAGQLTPPDTDIDFLIVPRPDTSSEQATCPTNIGRYTVLVR